MQRLDVHSNGTIERWDTDSFPIIFPRDTSFQVNNVTKARGGCHPCFPVWDKDHGKVAGSQLPNHGLVRDSVGEYVSKGLQCIESFSSHMADDSFAWSYEFKTLTRLVSPRELFRRFTAECHLDSTGAGMPLAIGDHPYFSTFGEQFHLATEDITYDSADTVESEVKFIESPSIHLTTSRFEVYIHELKGFDRFAVWTDSKENYVCIEPITDPDKYGDDRLKLGESAVYSYMTSLRK